MANGTWSVKSTTIPTGRVKINKPPNGKSMQLDWTELKVNSANQAVKNLEMRVNDVDTIEFRYPTTSNPNGCRDGSGQCATADSVQEIADDSLYVANFGYSNTTTLLIQESTQKILADKAKSIDWTPPPPPPPDNNTGSGDDESPTDIRSISSPEEINFAKSGSPEKTFEILRYPEKIAENGQDYIKFEVFEYISQTLSDNNLLFEQRSSYPKKPIGTIVLPIQPTINDTNTVTWNDSKMGILEMMGANISLGVMNSTGTDYMTQMANKFGETIRGVEGEPVSPAVVTAVQKYIAKMAVSSNTNLLSRTAGAITNPNLNLLFESPDLRNFTFNFKLTPRTEREGKIVRRIIRKFKEHMAAQKSVGNLFLETPDVFNIKYIRGKDEKNNADNTTHKSLNLFKTCALRSFGVNYTPSGTYMTYNDTAGTMSSYDLTMSFTELEPVYWNDYQDKDIADDQIGY
ncbi:MAG: Synechococcus phage [Bacteroidota bacterium]|jgi:hypothetical protein